MHPFAVGTDPGGAITHAPFVFIKTLGTNLKTTNATPAKGFFFLTTVATIRFFAATSGIFFRHGYFLPTTYAIHLPSISGKQHLHG